MTENRIAIASRALWAELAAVCVRCGRDPSEITLVAVTKTRAIGEINTALAAGIRVIGENRVQEALGKFPELQPCERHFIGHLQMNKVFEVVANFDCVESVDSVRLAMKLDQAAKKLDKTLVVFLQVNLTREATKSGFAESELIEAVPKIRQLPNLKLTGLLVIGPRTQEVELIRAVFRQGKKLTEKFELSGYSAGMSDDWMLAVECGATHLRLGRAIFESHN